MRIPGWLAPALAVLAAGVAAVSILGPLMLGVLEHRTSDTTVVQLIGADAAGLFVVAPLTALVALLVWRNHPAAAALALPPGVYAAYTYTQYALGQEFLDAPGNVERFFPLLLGLFVLGAAIAIGAWGAVDADRLPPFTSRLRRSAIAALLFVAVFLTFGLHLPMLPDALSSAPSRPEYVSSPTAFWVVKFMDLGMLVPAAIAIAIGLHRGTRWARKATYAVLGGYTLIGASVAGMAITMQVTDAPDSSLALVAAFALLASAFAALTIALYRPLFGKTARVGASANGVAQGKATSRAGQSLSIR